MLDFGVELTLESYRIPWLIWIQLIVLLLLLVLFFLLSFDDSPTPTSTASASASVSASAPAATHLHNHDSSSTALTNRLQNTRVHLPTTPFFFLCFLFYPFGFSCIFHHKDPILLSLPSLSLSFQLKNKRLLLLKEIQAFRFTFTLISIFISCDNLLLIW